MKTLIGHVEEYIHEREINARLDQALEIFKLIPDRPLVERLMGKIYFPACAKEEYYNWVGYQEDN